MFVAVPSALLTEHERAAVQAERLDELVAGHRAAAQRRIDERLSQGFSLAEALRFAAAELQAARRAAVMRDVTRMEVRELL
jgi:uncharacterized protein YoaH (UPF0181 family)